MSQPTNALPGSWHVTSTAETTDQNDGGQFVPGIRVSFTTGRGHQGSVFLPVAAATRDNVRAAITARVAQLDAISDLSSDGAGA